MAETVYLIPGEGIYIDTEQDSIQLIPGGGIYIEQEGDTGSILLPILFTQKRLTHSSIGIYRDNYKYRTFNRILLAGEEEPGSSILPIKLINDGLVNAGLTTGRLVT